MRIMVTGLRGIPNIQGGVETHAEHLYPLLVEMGCDVEVIARSPHYASDRPDHWRGIKLYRLWSPKLNGLEAFIHTLLAVLRAGLKRPDVLHIHAIGPAIMTPLARVMGLKVVVTHHGPDYDREKWGKAASWILQTGERLGMKWSSQRIVISDVIKSMVMNKYNAESTLIYNGVTIPDIPDTQAILDKFSLSKGRYILQVSRLVPEKRQLDLINAFIHSGLDGWKLVFAGKLDEEDKYTQQLLKAARDFENIIFTDYQSGTALNELYAHAGIFVLPSSHEGLPIALLEAMSYGLRVVASNIPANLEIGLPDEQYFPLGNIEQLSSRLSHFAHHPATPDETDNTRRWVREKYDWNVIARQTLEVYQATS